MKRTHIHIHTQPERGRGRGRGREALTQPKTALSLADCEIGESIEG